MRWIRNTVILMGIGAVGYVGSAYVASPISKWWKGPEELPASRHVLLTLDTKSNNLRYTGFTAEGLDYASDELKEVNFDEFLGDGEKAPEETNKKRKENGLRPIKLTPRKITFEGDAKGGFDEFVNALNGEYGTYLVEIDFERGSQPRRDYWVEGKNVAPVSRQKDPITGEEVIVVDDLDYVRFIKVTPNKPKAAGSHVSEVVDFGRGEVAEDVASRGLARKTGYVAADARASRDEAEADFLGLVKEYADKLPNSNDAEILAETKSIFENSKAKSAAEARKKAEAVKSAIEDGIRKSTLKEDEKKEQIKNIEDNFKKFYPD